MTSSAYRSATEKANASYYSSKSETLSLSSSRTLKPGEWTNRVPIRLLRRQGRYKCLTTGEALFLASLATLRPQQYFNKSRLCKAAGIDYNSARAIIKKLEGKGFIRCDKSAWVLILPEDDGEQSQATSNAAALITSDSGKTSTKPDQSNKKTSC